jgi:hypothetical protein
MLYVCNKNSLLVLQWVLQPIGDHVHIFLCPVSKDRGQIVFWTVRLFVCLQKLNIGHIFWMASDKAFIFHMCVPYDGTLLLVPKVLTLWPWPWSLTHFSKTLTLAIYF